MSEEKVKLPRSSYDELCKIIQAYGRLEEPSTLKKVSELSGVGASQVSANNKFLISIGLIDKGLKKSATDLGNKLAKPLEFDFNDDIKTIWELIVNKNEFLSKMVLAIKIRRKTEVETFVSHIAYSAGESNEEFVKVGARAVVDILKASGLIIEQDGNLLATEDRSKIDVVNEAKESINCTSSESFGHIRHFAKL